MEKKQILAPSKAAPTIRPRASLFGRLATLALTIALTSCLTINVNFPEHAVQKAADDFVGDLYSNKPTGASGNTSDSDQALAESNSVKSSVKKSSKKKHKLAPASTSPATETPAPAPVVTPSTWNINIGLSEALAQEINTSSPKANAIKDRMRARIPEMKKWKEKGAICESDDALLIFKHPDKAGPDAAAVKALVTDENKDRDEFYQEVAMVNRITDRSQTKIRKFFAAAFKKHSPPGTCFEN